MNKNFSTFKEFYPFYLSEHQNRMNRRLHFIGTSGVIVILLAVVISGFWWGLLLLPVCGYGFAWVGHFFFEHNRPATFSYPLYSFIGDWVMYWEVLNGRLRL